MKRVLLLFCIISGLSFLPKAGPVSEEQPYLSPTYISENPASQQCYVSLSTARKIAVVNAAKGEFGGYIPLPFNPGETVVGPDAGILYVTDGKPAGSVHAISLETREIIRSIRVGHSPEAMAISPSDYRLYVGNRFSNSLSVIDTRSLELIEEVPVGREPSAIAISPSGQLVGVANSLPDGAANDTFVSATISLIDSETLQVVETVVLTNGSHSIRDLVFSRDGRYLYASHILSRNTLPTTQIEHGWINCNAVSVLDTDNKAFITTFLLDDFDRGAANPSGMCLSPEGDTLLVALSGVHELAVIDLDKLHARIDGSSAQEINEVPYNFQFLHGIKKRISTQAKSPRHVQSFGKQILVSCYFSPHLVVITDLEQPDKQVKIELGQEPEMSKARQGELLFCDADLCFQKWQSCISCHPDARADGLNWDLLNDGMGNPKNVKSMLFTHFTPPVMITGVRDSAEIAVRSGIKYILFTQYHEAQAQAIDVYLKSLRPVPSPYLHDGKLSKAALRGRKVFRRVGCADCHSGPFYTDGLKYDVGTGLPPHENDKFDVPALNEVWRTAPYLYDGRAKTMKAVFTEFNHDDAHGRTSKLSSRDLNNLMVYVLSL